MKKLLIGIGKKSKKAFSNQVDVKKKNKVLKEENMLSLIFCMIEVQNLD